MNPFESALAEESLYLAQIFNQPMPNDPRSGHRTYIGPTAYINVQSATNTLVPEHEAAMLANFRS